MWIALGIAGFVLLLATFPLLLAFPIACWETRYAWPYEPLHDRSAPARFSSDAPPAANPYQSPEVSGDPPPPLTSDAKFWNESAQALGMNYVAVLRHMTSKVIRARYDFWLPPDRSFLAIIGGGKVASIPVNSIALWSVLSDGRIFVTINADASADPDLTGMTSEMLYPGDGFQQLAYAHVSRLQSAGGAPQLFSADHPLQDLFQLRQLKYHRLEDLGYCRFLDSNRNAYRLTIRGAWWYSLFSVGRSYRRQFSPDRKPALR